MNTIKFEIFESGQRSWGLILKDHRKFLKLNQVLNRYPKDARMIKGEEVLFRVGEDKADAVASILARNKAFRSNLFKVVE
jgi:hypothetical protein